MQWLPEPWIGSVSWCNTRSGIQFFPVLCLCVVHQHIIIIIKSLDVMMYLMKKKSNEWMINNDTDPPCSGLQSLLVVVVRRSWEKNPRFLVKELIHPRKRDHDDWILHLGTSFHHRLVCSIEQSSWSHAYGRSLFIIIHHSSYVSFISHSWLKLELGSKV